MPGIRRKTATYRKTVDFSLTPETVTEDNNRNCQIKSQNTSRHNGIIPIKIKGHTIQEHMAYFISDEDSSKGKDPNINIINGIHNIKGKTSVTVLISNFTNKHVTFNKGEYVGHLEPPMEEIPQTSESPDVLTTHSVTTEKNKNRKGRARHFQATPSQAETAY